MEANVGVHSVDMVKGQMPQDNPRSVTGNAVVRLILLQNQQLMKLFMPTINVASFLVPYI